MITKNSKRYTNCAAMLATCSLVIGCVVTKAPESRLNDVSGMTDGNGRWTATKEGRSGVDRDWVKRFSDAKLSRLVNEAVTSNPDMRVAAERVKQAQQTAYIAGASGRLKSSVGLDGNRRKNVFVGFPFGGSQTSNTYGLDLMVSWEPDIWGRVSAGVSAAVADAQAVELERRAAESSLAARVCKAWFALCEAHEQNNLASQAHELRKKTLEAVRERFESALTEEGGAASQLRLAETNLATSLANKAKTGGDVEAAQRQLELLVGRYPSASLKGSVKLPRVPAKPPSGLPSELLMRRPDILAAERRYAATGKSIREARLAVFPQIKLTGNGGSNTDSLSKILSSQFGVWSIGANISQNILTGGQVKGELSIRTSRERQALAELQSTVLKAFGEVESALAADRWLAKRITELEKANKLASEAASSSEEDFVTGNVDLLTVLTAQNNKIDIASSLVLLRRVQLDNRVNLHLALGGEFRTVGRK